MRLILVLLLLAACGGNSSGPTRLVLAATTSLEDTGLLDTLAVAFERDHPEIQLAPIAVGTGQAIQLGRRGDADVLIVHDSAAEMKLVADGVALERRSLMHNDFVIAGPAHDPAGARGNDAAAALRAIAASGSLFVSRGDDSGTHRKELQLWREAGIPNSGEWYVEAGVGQGDALILASQKGAYLLSDRATYLRFKPRLALEVVAEGDPRLVNSYGVIVLNGDRKEEALILADWVTSTRGQEMIARFGRAEFGESIFNPSVHGAALHDTIPTGER